MISLFHDPGFWTFSTALITSVAGLYRHFANRSYLNQKKLIEQKSQAEKEKIRLEKENIDLRFQTVSRAEEALKAQVDRQELLLVENQKAIASLSSTLEQIQNVNSELTQNYQENQKRVEAVKEGGNIILERLKKIETEVIQLKGGNILIKGERK